MLFLPPDLKRAQGDDVEPRQMFIESNALRALTTRTELFVVGKRNYLDWRGVS